MNTEPRENDFIPKHHFAIETLPQPDGTTVVKAGLGDEIYRYPPREAFVPYPTQEDWDEMDDEDRDFYKDYDPTAVYLERMGKLMQDYNALKQQCDLLADALAETGNHSKLSPEAEQAYSIISGLSDKAVRDATPEMYAALPVETKHLIEYADRLEQLRHLYGGSSYTSPLDNLYSPEEAQRCVEDFCKGAEMGLSASISNSGKTYRVEFERPSSVRYLNALSNLTYTVIEHLEAPNTNNESVDAMFHGAVRSLTDPYRGAKDL